MYNMSILTTTEQGFKTEMLYWVLPALEPFKLFFLISRSGSYSYHITGKSAISNNFRFLEISKDYSVLNILNMEMSYF